MGIREEQQDASTDVVELAPDILRMQLPISMPGLGHVNTYALLDERGVALVDPGLPGKRSHLALVERLKQVGLKVGDVHTVVVTHSHPDHFGGAGILRERAGAEVVTHRSFRTWLDADEGDEATADQLGADDDADADAQPRRTAPARPWGMDKPWGGGTYKIPPKRRMQMGMARFMAKRWMKAPSPTRRIDDAQVITLGRREWVAYHTPGHTEDHLCLLSPADGIVLSGDHVLPTITPHISGLAADTDPLKTFFDSLARMAEIDDVSLVLPAHGHPFEDLGGRCCAIREHHDERLDALRAASESLGEASVVELSHHLFKQRSWGPMAESETYAHLEHLRLNGEMTSRHLDEQLCYTMVNDSTS